jgi:hypothetical protein
MGDYIWLKYTNGGQVTWTSQTSNTADWRYRPYQEPIYYTGSQGWSDFLKLINTYANLGKKVLNKNIRVL